MHSAGWLPIQVGEHEQKVNILQQRLAAVWKMGVFHRSRDNEGKFAQFKFLMR
jgi:hypothetical protein